MDQTTTRRLKVPRHHRAAHLALAGRVLGDVSHPNRRTPTTPHPQPPTRLPTLKNPAPRGFTSFRCLDTSHRTSDRTRTCNLRGRSSLLYPVELRRHIYRTPSAATRYTHCLTPVRASAESGVGMVGVAQLVRAPGCGPGGRGFESPRSPVESPPAISRTSSSIW